ncbi:MAG: M28 family peptidase [Thermoanaerobaculaceae bacterium]|nr:M28 family peptidase [Thermoanaerobaculaceae bacterium]
MTRLARGAWPCIVLGISLWAGVAAGQEAARPRFGPATFEAHARFLSSDLLEGRGIASRGGQLAASYIEAVFRAAGLQPAFEGSFRQPVAMTAFHSDPEAQVGVEVGMLRVHLLLGEEVVGINFGLPDDRLASDLLFVGYGIHAPAEGWDDYKDVDVRGRLLLAFVNEPGRDDPSRFRGRALTIHGRWTTKLEQAARRGAAGMILIHTDADAGYGWNVPYNSMTREKFQLADEPWRLPFSGWIAEPALRRILSAGGLQLETLRTEAEKSAFRPHPLPTRMTVEARRSARTVQGENVVGVLPGGKPGTVVLSAHFDHLGIGPEVAGDTIYNGAVDNGSALAVFLSLAQGMSAVPAAQRPTLVFAAVDAEEEGFLGSTFYTRHPAVPLAQTLANINFEMTNPWGPTRDLLGIGAEHSELQAMLGRVAAHRGLAVSTDSAPEQGFFFRSDQLAFARAGVPALWLDGGTDYEGRPPQWGVQRRAAYRDTAYHRPSDVVGADWDWRGLQQIAEVTVDLIAEIARAGQVRWLPGSEFAPPPPPTQPVR